MEGEGVGWGGIETVAEESGFGGLLLVVETVAAGVLKETLFTDLPLFLGSRRGDVGGGTGGGGEAGSVVPRLGEVSVLVAMEDVEAVVRL